MRLNLQGHCADMKMEWGPETQTLVKRPKAWLGPRKRRRRNLGGLHPRRLGILYSSGHGWDPHLAPPGPTLSKALFSHFLVVQLR